MDNIIIMGIVADINSLDGLINNLEEEEIEEKNISYLMKDQKTARQIIGDFGPLKNLTSESLIPKLQSLKIAPAEIKEFQNALEIGQGIIAVFVNKNLVATVSETFHDYKIEKIKII